MATKKKDVDIFDEEVKEEKDPVELESDVVAPDDLKEGFIAESDPKSKVKSPMDAHKGPAKDMVKQSLDKQLTALGRETAKKLNAMPKHKVVVPYKELNPNDHFVVVGTNGWNMQIKRGTPVMLPEEIINRLSESGENPTLVR